MEKTVQEGWIDYIELPATSIEQAKRFYGDVFGWSFKDYGPDYTCFHDGRLAGGFFFASRVLAGGPVVVIYSSKLEEMRDKITDAGGTIVRQIFEFPGGRRFHFTDPDGNELAVWSNK